LELRHLRLPSQGEERIELRLLFTFNGITRRCTPRGSTSIPGPPCRRIGTVLKPFSFDIHDIKTQVGKVTIMNNVIDPEKGETRA
jgi:hypothetical protein